jgi:hypothetical protein
MPNHISPESEQFKDFVKNGEASRYKDMFVRWEDIWPEGGCTQHLNKTQLQHCLALYLQQQQQGRQCHATLGVHWPMHSC